jgi:hypothetical protein
LTRGNDLGWRRPSRPPATTPGFLRACDPACACLRRDRTARSRRRCAAADGCCCSPVASGWPVARPAGDAARPTRRGGPGLLRQHPGGGAVPTRADRDREREAGRRPLGVGSACWPAPGRPACRREAELGWDLQALAAVATSARRRAGSRLGAWPWSPSCSPSCCSPRITHNVCLRQGRVGGAEAAAAAARVERPVPDKEARPVPPGMTARVPPRPRRPAGQHPQRPPAGGNQHPPWPRHRQRLPVAGRGEPELRRRPPHRPGDPRSGPPRQSVPPDDLGHPDPGVPGPAGRHDRQQRPVGHRRGSRLDLGVGTALLADPTQPSSQEVGHRKRPSRGGGGDRTARPGPWARRRPGVPGHDRRIVAGELPARPDHQRPGREGPGPSGGQRAAATPRRTRPAERMWLGDQVVQDRSGPPEQDQLLLTT